MTVFNIHRNSTRFFLTLFYKRLKFRAVQCQTGRVAVLRLEPWPACLHGGVFTSGPPARVHSFSHTHLLLIRPLLLSWNFQVLLKANAINFFSFNINFNYNNLVEALFPFKTIIWRQRLSRSRSLKANCIIKGFPSHQPIIFLSFTDLEDEQMWNYTSLVFPS